MKWDVLPPEAPCSSPHGHEPMEVRSARSDVPVIVMCERCGERYTVVVFTGQR